jgi:hypothetical protein
MAFDPVTGHNFVPTSTGMTVECAYCLQQWTITAALVGITSKCPGVQPLPLSRQVCSYCGNPTLSCSCLPSSSSAQPVCTCFYGCKGCPCVCHTQPTMTPPDPAYQGVAVSDVTAVDKCECGAFKAMGAGRGNAGHSSWCPWRSS